MNETFSILRELTGYEGRALYGPERAGDIKHSLADIGAARRHLGYEPCVDFREGLQRTVDWYRHQNTEHNPSAQASTVAGGSC